MLSTMSQIVIVIELKLLYAIIKLRRGRLPTYGNDASFLHWGEQAYSIVYLVKKISAYQELYENMVTYQFQRVFTVCVETMILYS